MNISSEKHFPPLVGEFAYYDDRMNPGENYIIDLNRWHICRVRCHDGANRDCNYSLPYRSDQSPYVTCHGKITSVSAPCHRVST